MKSNNRPEIGQIVLLNIQNMFMAKQEPKWVEHEVIELLATQFLSRQVGSEHERFRFYAHKGDAWKDIEE